jgi:hypothetical protein
VYVSDGSGYTIRKILADGTVSTLAGLAGSPGKADGKGSAARFTLPRGIAVDGLGNIYIADNFSVRKIIPDGTVTTLAGQSSGFDDGRGAKARFAGVTGVAVDSYGNVFAADSVNFSIRKVSPDGTVFTAAGGTQISGFTDDMGLSAQFSGSLDVLVTATGTVYVVDKGNSSIRTFKTQRGQ